MIIETTLNLQEIDKRVSEIQRKGKRLIVFPCKNKIVYANRDGDKLTLRNSTFRASGNINIHEKKIRFKVDISIAFKIAGVLTLLLFAVAIFSNKVTINGNANPSVVERLSYFGFGLLLLLIPVLILLKQKSDFEQVIKEVLANKSD